MPLELGAQVLDVHLEVRDPLTQVAVRHQLQRTIRAQVHGRIIASGYVESSRVLVGGCRRLSVVVGLSAHQRMGRIRRKSGRIGPGRRCSGGRNPVEIRLEDHLDGGVKMVAMPELGVISARSPARAASTGTSRVSE